LYPIQTAFENDPASDWTPYAIVSADDQPVKSQSYVGTANWFVMSSKCEHPEAVVKLFNLYAEKTFDPDKQEYTVYSQPPAPAAQEVWKLAPVITYLATKNLDNYRNIQEPLKTGDTGKLFGEQLAMYEYCKDFQEGNNAYFGWYRTFGPGSTWSITDSYHQNDQILLSGYSGPPTPTMVERHSTLQEIQKELITKIIMGQENVDAFDAFAADWLNLGGQAITDEVNAALGK
jgi:putative aldouronate transport system substrate-binding protein